jgi:hypothetical protein
MMMSHLSLRIAAIAAALMPAAMAGAQEQPAKADARHFAIAVNPDYLGYFVVTGEKKGSVASKVVMRMCSKATGKGCELLMAAKGDHLILGYGPDGNVFYAVRATPEEAKAALDTDCRQKYGGTCFIDSSFDVAVKAKMEPPVERRKFAAIALQVDGDQPMTEDDRIWLATGQPSARDAIDNAMSRCTAAVGEGKCRHIVTSGQTHIAFYRDAEAVSGGFQISMSSQAAIGAVNRTCKADAKQCLIVALNAAAEVVETEYDLRRMPGVPLE